MWNAEQSLLRAGSFEQSSRQVTLTAHRPAHHDIAARQFVKENVLVERPGNEKEAPFVQKRMSETPAWPQIRMLAQQPAGGLHGVVERGQPVDWNSSCPSALLILAD